MFHRETKRLPSIAVVRAAVMSSGREAEEPTLHARQVEPVAD